MTYLELAPLAEVSTRTIIRWLKTGNDIPQFLDALNDGKQYRYGKNDNLPLRVCGYLAMTKEKPSENVKELDMTDQEIARLLQLDKPTDDKSKIDPNHACSGVVPPKLSDMDIDFYDEQTKAFAKQMANNLDQKAFESLMEPKEEDQIFKAYIGPKENPIAEMTLTKDKETSQLAPKPVTKLSDKIMHGDTPPVLAVAALVMADAFSFGWLSLKIFVGNYLAVTFFSLLGIAVAYAAIVNAVRYKDKWTAESWLWGFGVFQGLLHATAFEVFTTETWQDINLAIGKLIICICIPLATTGIAIIFKSDVNG